MFTHKDIETRTIFVLNCVTKERGMRVQNGELLLEEKDNNGKNKTLTKMPFQKMLALFVIGHISITTPLIEKCKQFGVALVVMKPTLRPVFFWADSAEANYLLRKKQHLFNVCDITIAKILVSNKISNQILMLKNTRRQDSETHKAILICERCLENVSEAMDYNALLGTEGLASKAFFSSYFQDFTWSARKPRTKCDEINVILDIGYTILFNFIESYLRLFGFDIYIGVYHRLWFKRKSLVCDLVEPFRCIIDRTIRTALGRQQFQMKDFKREKGEYMLKRERNADYHKVFFDALIPYKIEIYKYIQCYYRCFMSGKKTEQYPKFIP